MLFHIEGAKFFKKGQFQDRLKQHNLEQSPFLKTRQQYIHTVYNVECDLSLTVLVLGTSKISLISLSTSDINSF